MSNWHSEHLRILQGFAGPHSEHISGRCPHFSVVTAMRCMYFYALILYILHLHMPYVFKYILAD